jgi:DNA polymerase bacteriophage-type
MPKLHLDFESRSVVDLKTTNVYVYAEHETTDCWGASYSVDDGPVQDWERGEPVPFEIIEAANDGWTVCAWNAAFERTMWRLLCTRKYGWPDVSKLRWDCTMARAYAMALPGSLDGAAKAVKLPIEKDDAGHRLMMKMARPRKMEGSVITWWDDEDHRSRLIKYRRQDVAVEVEMDKKLLQLRPFEKQIYALDQLINDRGFAVDVALVERAQEVVDRSVDRLDAAMKEVTAGGVAGCSNVQQLRQWLAAQGVHIDSLDKEHIEILLLRDLPPAARRAVELREEASKVSTAKLKKMLACRLPATGRVNGSLQYHAASTGRWGGRGVQPQNFKRPDMDDPEIDTALNTIRFGPDAVAMAYEKPMSTVSNCMRGMLCAGTGRRYLSADYSNIEGRTNAWLAGEQWKLDAFSAYDQKLGPDLYLVAASKIFGIPVERAKPHRQIGKVSELALGFQGGPGAFAAMARTYQLKIGDHFETVWNAVSDDVRDKVTEAWNERGRGSGMPKRDWMAGEAIKVPWRAGHPKIVAFWWDLENCVVEALESPGRVVTLRNLSFLYRGNTFFIRLPSGRSLVYPFARLVMKETPFKDKDGNPVMKPGMRYKGVDSFTKRWGDIDTYGGKLCENIVQAVARDVMAEAMVRVEAAGYPIVLTVHDEILAEPRAEFGSLDEFSQIMAVNPPWAFGLPITVDRWEGQRYRK